MVDDHHPEWEACRERDDDENVAFPIPITFPKIDLQRGRQACEDE